MTMIPTDIEQVRELLATWCNSLAAQRVMDTRTKEQFEQRQLQYSVSIPYNELDKHWSELPSRNSPFALLLPLQENTMDEKDSVLYKLRVRGWTPTVVLWDQPLLWSVATSMGLTISNSTDIISRSIRFLFTPCPFLEEQIPRIETLKGTNNVNISVSGQSPLVFRLCDIGCGSGRDVAWMLARSSKSQHHHSSSNYSWNAHAIDAWQGAVKRTCQLLASRHFTTERARSNGNIRYYDNGASSSNVTSTADATSSLMVNDQSTAKQLMETSTYDLVIAVRFLERAAFPHIDSWVAPDGVCDYEQPAGRELAMYFGESRGYTVMEDRIDWTEDGRPLNSFLAVN
ncbi:hypothetical protein BDF22DRAFT_697738 [Syncephalis plumigaleata]|nr:hypothetical protein BDF22DRAFT_697738 [Syncephalis plumigaleata]